MAQQTINIGSVANDGTGDPLRTAFDKVNDNFTELYNDDAGDVNQVTGSGGITASPTTGNVVVSLDDDSITYAKLGTEFTTSAAVAATTLDFSTAQVFTKANSGTVTYTITNADTGMVKDLILTGDYTIAFVDNPTIISGTYDGTVANLIQVIVTAPNTYYMSISQPQV